MRTSQYLLATLKEIPKNCDSISYQLMLRAGLIRKISSGLYSWLPTGLRVLKKIEKIIREEMNKNGAIEIIMPIVQPANLWKQSGRWSKYGTELLRFKNRNNQDFILSPTHEEMITKLICKEILPYKQFPLNVYQINTKYRDEARPQFGIIRSREFIMKDGYSFHTDHKSLQYTYENMYNVYNSIFNRVKINFFVNQANSDKMGGTLSHEFQAYSYSKNIVFPHVSYKNKKNINQPLLNDSTITLKNSSIFKKYLRLIADYNINSILELTKKFNVSMNQIVKTIIVHTKKSKKNNPNFLGLVIRADHTLNDIKISKIPDISNPITFANSEEISILTKSQPNLLGPINISSIPLIVDYNVANMSNFIAGSNINGHYFVGVNWNRDFPIQKIADLYNASESNNYTNDNTSSVQKYIEIGHIFQLGEKYSNIYKNFQKNNLNIKMGCYGIGITRIIAIIIEQNHDENGILWPDIIAPFKLAIIPINMHNSINVRKITENLYSQLFLMQDDILIDDRKERPGIIFNDIDLIGIPHILIISDHNLKNKEIEYKYRKTKKTEKIKTDILLQFLLNNVFN